MGSEVRGGENTAAAILGYGYFLEFFDCVHCFFRYSPNKSTRHVGTEGKQRKMADRDLSATCQEVCI